LILNRKWPFKGRNFVFTMWPRFCKGLVNSACFERTFSCIHFATRTQHNLQQGCCEETAWNIILVQKRKDLYYTEDNADVATRFFCFPTLYFWKLFCFQKPVHMKLGLLNLWNITHSYLKVNVICTVWDFAGATFKIIQGDQKVSVHLTITVQYNWWFEDVHHRIHSECGPCYNEHGPREHSSSCQ